MNRNLLFFILLLSGLQWPLSSLKAQNKSPQQSLSMPSVDDSLALGEQLVWLAWENHPANDAVRYAVEQEEETITQARWDWLNDFSASFNLNEGNINPDATGNNTNLFFPRYNFRLAVSVGTFVNTPSKIRRAKLGREIAEEVVDEQQLSMRREVLSRYYTYLYNINLLKLKMQAYQDVYSSYTSATQSFTNGEISLDEYNKALQARNEAQEGKLEAERTLLISKLELEELLGMTLEKAIEVVKAKP
jgi:outer membrane protein TolC